ncbi:sterol desaturase family protein [Paenibacillus sp. CF384]|uniref:sterol desaturase family protein n=1 Tax=Paenibacillus sp. CF384 TaxID=1884382 RepID=UPI000896D49D|nr:sterol desaturase family protein [Paenibacillus sp. CF384]SDX06644.1 Fatty acid hydroxylase superfamily protein [Paenibacillus sp. CF384]
MRSETTRMQYTREFLGQHPILFLISIVILSCCGVIATFGSLWTIPAICVGAVLFILIEYTAHRFVLHECPQFAPKSYKGHVAHHETPNDVKHLFGPVAVDVYGYLIILAAAYLVTGFDWHLSLAVVFGTSSFQIYYQWQHYIAHRPIVPFTPWGKWMKKRHLLHHHMDEKAMYGVTNPVMDMVLQTNRLKRKNRSTSFPKPHKGDAAHERNDKKMA